MTQRDTHPACGAERRGRGTLVVRLARGDQGHWRRHGRAVHDRRGDRAAGRRGAAPRPPPGGRGVLDPRGRRHARGRRRDDRGERGRLRVRPARDPAPLHRRRERVPDALHLHPGGLRESRPRDERACRCPDVAAALRRGAGLGARRRSREGELTASCSPERRTPEGARHGRAPAFPVRNPAYRRVWGGVASATPSPRPPRAYRRHMLPQPTLADIRAASATFASLGAVDRATRDLRAATGRRLDPAVPAHRDALLAGSTPGAAGSARRVPASRCRSRILSRAGGRSGVAGCPRGRSTASARATSSVSATLTRASPPWR